MIHCPTCGAGLRFEIETQQMFCGHCQNRFDPQQLADKSSDDAKTEKTFESYAYICPSCGAELLTTDEQDAVGFCPYCGGASMIFDKIRRDWKPDYVIPFSVTREQCREAYVKEVKRHPFVARKYRDPKLIESFRGIYMPYWSYNAALDGDFRFYVERKKTGFVSGNVKTEDYEVSGKVKCELDGYTHDASISFDDHISEKLAPYDTSVQRPFHPGYLCGFYAEAGDAQTEEYNLIAREELIKRGFEVIADDPSVKGLPKRDRVFLKENYRLPLKIRSADKVLYPVWFMSYRRKDKITYAAVNGQTGKVGADLPLSPLRILVAALGAAAVIFGALLLLMTFLPSVKAKTVLGVCSVLMLAGQYVAQNSFIQTVSKVLRTDISVGDRGKNAAKASDLPSASIKMPLRYLFLVAVAVAAVIGYTSDGSYERTAAMIWAVVFVLTIIPVFQFHIAQGRETRKIGNLKISSESMLKSGILTEAKRLLKPLKIFRIAVYLTVLLCFAVVFFDLPNNYIYYGLSVALMCALFALAMIHVRFQVTVAKRRPPQFNKKGAAYDEN